MKNNKPINEISKYRKRKNSFKSKAKNRSKCKHITKDCIIKYKFKNKTIIGGELKDCYTYFKGEYCTICGKLVGEKYNILATKDDIRDSNIKIFTVNDIFQKYIDLKEE